MSADSHIFLLAKVHSFLAGNVSTDNDGSITFNLSSGESRSLLFPFVLPRSATSGLGATLRSVASVLRVVSGTLTSITPTLNRITNSNLANQTSTAVTIGAASPTFVLVPNGTPSNFNRNVNSVTTPTIDNQADSVSVTYMFQLTIVATAASQIEMHGLDVQFGYGASVADGGVSSPLRYGLSESFAQLAELNANVANANANKNFEIIGTNAAASTLAVGGGILIATSTGIDDQGILTTHQDAGQSAWRTTQWSTNQQVEWNCKLQLPTTISSVIAWAGLKLTDNTSAITTDADQIFFRYSTADANTNWMAIEAVGNVDVPPVDTGVVVAIAAIYRFRIVIDSSRIARCYINDVLVHTTAALTASVNFIPVIGIHSTDTVANSMQVYSQSISRAT